MDWGRAGPDGMVVVGGTDLWQATSPTLTKTANSSGLFFIIPSRPSESRLSCGALTKDSFLNLRAPAASSAC